MFPFRKCVYQVNDRNTLNTKQTVLLETVVSETLASQNDGPLAWFDP